jgi:hypothetical protein
MHMTAHDEHDPNFHDGFVGVSRKELEVMSGSELAQWQSTLKLGEPKHVLAEREWQRRMIAHQLQEQYNLDAKLAKAAEDHAVKIARNNRWWSIATAVIGVLGTLAGAVIGRISTGHVDASSTQSASQESAAISLQEASKKTSAAIPRRHQAPSK